MRTTNIEAIVIGGSAGALNALALLLPALPAGFPLPVAIVVHVPPTRPNRLAEVLNASSTLLVKEAEDKEPIVGGHIYVAPANYHLLIERDHTFALSVDEPVFFSRPAIDVLFESAADAYGDRLAGVVLTGASEDGARGLAAIRKGGGLAIVQDPKDAWSAVMPRAAIATGVDHVLPVEQIALLLPTLAAVGVQRKDFS